MIGFGDLEHLVLLWNERLRNRRSTTPLEFGLSLPRKGIVAVFDCSFSYVFGLSLRTVVPLLDNSSSETRSQITLSRLGRKEFPDTHSS
jgi:hypothetical protein